MLGDVVDREHVNRVWLTGGGNDQFAPGVVIGPLRTLFDGLCF